MRILCLYYTHKRGGFCKRLYRLLSALSRAGHEVYYYSLDPVPDTLDSGVIRCRIPFLLSKRSGLLFWILFGLYLPWFGLYAVLRKRPERILVFNPFYSFMLAFAAIVTNTPIVLFVRSSLRLADGNRKYFKHVIEAQFERFGCLAASTIICVSNHIKAQIAALSLSKSSSVHVLPNDLPGSRERELQENLPLSQESNEKRGIQARLIGDGYDSDVLVTITSGVLTKEKNVEFLVRTFSLLNELGGQKKIALLIAGVGSELDSIKLAKEKMLCDNVYVLGWVENIEDLLSASDILIHPSLHEGMPNSILEGLAARLVVLASDTPEHREVLIRDELLFALEESSLAELLLKIQTNRLELNKLRDLSMEVAERFRFDWDQRGVELIES